MANLSYNNGGAARQRKRNTFLSANPVMRRLDSVEEYAENDVATYHGIILKTGLFLIFTLAGMILNLFLLDAFSSGNVVHTNYRGFEIEMYSGEVVALVVTLILAIVFQLVAAFVKSATPVAGSLYCVTQGYFIGFLIFKVLKGYEYIGMLAFAITMVIVLTMLLLYSKGVIKATKKLRTVLFTLVITSFVVSLLAVIASFIPVTRPMIMTIRQNYALSIGFSLFFIIIASLFLICDFDTIDHVVNNRLPKKYEWQAAFGLAFTIVWIYLKVLELLITILGKKKN
ncbi:MAG: Bax inhibitor-1/YccA family protein [Ruminococcaceae bacterium]|nr:Bax inhibitor-1/YccA family protein [Oscillospiraceae bacterium]